VSKDWIWVGLLAVAGFLLGGVYATWKTAKAMSVALIVATLLAVGGAAAWYFS